MIDSIYRFLDVGKPPNACDCIFVLAGRQERKIYGINLWRGGHAPELILSVGRFEWRKFYTLGIKDDGGLKSQVDVTPAQARHFFVRMRESRVESILIERSRFGTMTEGRALAALLCGSPIHALMVVSTSIHLRRVALVFRKAFRGSGIKLSFVGVPEALSSISRPDIVASKIARSAVWQEFRKYLFYHCLLLFPLRSARTPR